MRKILKKLFEGRLCRWNYIFALLITPLILYIPVIAIWAILRLFVVLFGIDESNTLIEFIRIFLLFTITSLIPLVLGPTLVIRRHHDINQSWYYPLIVILAIIIFKFINSPISSFVGGLYTLFLILKAGSEIKNNYGEVDKPRGLKSIFGL